MAAGYLFLNLYLLLKQVLLQFVIVVCMHVDENYSGFTGPWLLLIFKPDFSKKCLTFQIN